MDRRRAATARAHGALRRLGTERGGPPRSPGACSAPDMPAMLYARCARPLTAEADRLRRIVREQQRRLHHLRFGSVRLRRPARRRGGGNPLLPMSPANQRGLAEHRAHQQERRMRQETIRQLVSGTTAPAARWNVKLAEASHPTEITVGVLQPQGQPRAEAAGGRVPITFDAERTRIQTPTWPRRGAGGELPTVAARPGSHPAASPNRRPHRETLGAKLDSVEKAVHRKSRCSRAHRTD